MLDFSGGAGNRVPPMSDPDIIITFLICSGMRLGEGEGFLAEVTHGSKMVHI